MRKLLYTAVTTSSPLTTLVPVERIVARDALEERLETPFIIFAMLEELPRLGPVRSQQVDFWVHGEPGDYTEVDKVIAQLEATVPAILQAEGQGWRIMTAEWVGNGSDLSDDELRTSVRTGSFQLVGRRL